MKTITITLLLLFPFLAYSRGGTSGTAVADTAVTDAAWAERVRNLEALEIRRERGWRESLAAYGRRPSATVEAVVPSLSFIAVKTNAVAWAAAVMNIAAEVRVGRRWSVELPVAWSPWHAGGKHAVKTFAIQPEARYWLATPGEGHFFGMHAHVGWFNVKWKSDRYQDAGRPLLGAGISYGYLLLFGGRWAGEFTLGAGYANMKHDTYYNIDNGARIDTRTKNYWGITRLGLSVVYRFNLKK